MKKLLKPKDILLLTLAGVGDIVEEVKDPFQAISSAYRNMYGFTPRRYKRHNFLQMVERSLKTQDIEKVAKGNEVFLRLTSSGKKRVSREFPISNLTQKWNKKWIMVIFDIAEKQRVIRDRLRVKVQNIGFGMLQESVWISPLPIGRDVKEMIEVTGLKDSVFVMEVSGFIFGNPKELANKIWHLDSIEEEYLEIKEKLSEINQLISTRNGRREKREAKLYKLEEKKRVLKREYLQLLARFPALPWELLPKTLQDVRKA